MNYPLLGRQRLNLWPIGSLRTAVLGAAWLLVTWLVSADGAEYAPCGVAVRLPAVATSPVPQVVPVAHIEPAEPQAAPIAPLQAPFKPTSPGATPAPEDASSVIQLAKPLAAPRPASGIVENLRERLRPPAYAPAGTTGIVGPHRSGNGYAEQQREARNTNGAASPSATMSLLRPFLLTKDGQSLGGRANGPAPSSTHANQPHRTAPLNKVPALARPFYMTNDGGYLSGAEHSTLSMFARGAEDSFGHWPAPFDSDTGSQGTSASLAAYQPGSGQPGSGQPGSGQPVPPGAEEVPAGPLDDDKSDKKSISGEQKLGSPPEDNTLQFLRFQTVLLEPGDWQIDVALTYGFTDNDFPLLVTPPLDVVEARIRQRQLAVPLELRYGLSKQFQLFVNVPIGWANTEFSIAGFDEFANIGGIGDVRAGVTALLRQGQDNCPDITATFAVSAPTGNDDFALGPVLLTPPELGEGVWSLSADLLFIHNYDPLVLFYGFGTRQGFETTFYGTEFRPGGQYNYNFGVGFAVNDQVTLSASFFGAYISEIHINDRRIEGTILEPMSIRLAATVAKCKRLLEPFVEFGITDDASAARFGLIQTF